MKKLSAILFKPKMWSLAISITASYSYIICVDCFNNFSMLDIMLDSKAFKIIAWSPLNLYLNLYSYKTQRSRMCTYWQLQFAQLFVHY